MPMKLMLRVRPGEELTCASFCWSRELIRLDLPTFERPRKANSGGPAGGKSFASVAASRNLAITFTSKKSTTETRRHGDKEKIYWEIEKQKQRHLTTKVTEETRRKTKKQG